MAKNYVPYCHKEKTENRAMLIFVFLTLNYFPFDELRTKYHKRFLHFSVKEILGIIT